MTARIASIFFAAVKAERSAFGLGTYEMPPVGANDPPFLLEVKDRLQRDQGGYSESGDRRRRRQYVFEIPGHRLAHDLVTEWTTGGLGMNPQCRPGIWVVREMLPLVDKDGKLQVNADNIPEWRPATKDEAAQMWQEDIAAARAADREYARMLHLLSLEMAEKPTMVKFIQDRNRRAAQRYYPDAHYLRDDALAAVKMCQFCQKRVAAATIKCPYCQEIIDVHEYARREAERKAEIKTVMDQMAQAARESRAA